MKGASRTTAYGLARLAYVAAAAAFIVVTACAVAYQLWWLVFVAGILFGSTIGGGAPVLHHIREGKS